MDIANLRYDVEKMENGIILHSPVNVCYSKSKISNNTHHFTKDKYIIIYNNLLYLYGSSMVLLVGRCPPLPEVKHATPDTSLAVNGTIVKYNCEEGYVFPNNTLNMTVSCNGVEWNITEAACSGQQ